MPILKPPEFLLQTPLPLLLPCGRQRGRLRTGGRSGRGLSSCDGGRQRRRAAEQIVHLVLVDDVEPDLCVVVEDLESRHQIPTGAGRDEATVA